MLSLHVSDAFLCLLSFVVNVLNIEVLNWLMVC